MVSTNKQILTLSFKTMQVLALLESAVIQITLSYSLSLHRSKMSKQESYSVEKNVKGKKGMYLEDPHLRS